MGSRKIPRGWAWKRIGEIAEVVGGSTPPRNHPEFFGGSIPWATPTDVTSTKGRYLDGTAETITEAGLRAAGLRLLPPGSVLVSSRATIGAVALASRSVATNQGFQNLIPGPHVDSLWLYHTVAGRRPDLQRLAAGSTFRELSRQSFKHLEVPVPPLCEQVAIARVLDAVERAIEKTEAVIEATERLRQALLHELLTHGIPGWHSEWKHVPGIGTVPTDWQVTTLETVATVQTGRAVGKRVRAGRLIRLPYLSVANVKDGYLDLRAVKMMDVAEDEVERFSLRKGDVLFTEGGDADKLGRGCVWNAEIEPCLHQNHVFAVRPLVHKLRPAFLAAYARSGRGKAYFLSCAKQTTNLASINSTQLRQFPLPLPSTEEQDRILEVLRGVPSAVDSAELLRVVKAQVADALLSGLVRVPARRPSMVLGDASE